MSTYTRRWLAVGGSLLAASLAVVAFLSAIEVRDCPAQGSCAWSPWLGVPAGLIALLALVACVRLAAWSRHGRGGADAGLILGGALVFGVFWIIAFVATLAATAD